MMYNMTMFRKNVFLTYPLRRHNMLNFLVQDIFLRLNIHQMFHLLNKKTHKKISRDLFFNRLNNFKNFIRKNRNVNITPEHCFDVTLADFEQIINNDFIQLEAE